MVVVYTMLSASREDLSPKKIVTFNHASIGFLPMHIPSITLTIGTVSKPLETAPSGQSTPLTGAYPWTRRGVHKPFQADRLEQFGGGIHFAWGLVEIPFIFIIERRLLISLSLAVLDWGSLPRCRTSQGIGGVLGLLVLTHRTDPHPVRIELLLLLLLVTEVLCAGPRGGHYRLVPHIPVIESKTCFFGSSIYCWATPVINQL